MGKKYSQKILATPGLARYWRMKSGVSESDAVASSVLSHSNAPAVVSSMVNDSADTARSYNGSNQYSTCPSNWAAGLSALSIECWFKESALVDWSWIAGHDSYPTARFEVIRRAGETNLILGIRDPVAGVDADCIGPYTPLGVNFMTATMSQANGIRLMVNGSLVASNPSPIANPFPSGSLDWVVAGNGGGSFNGAIDEVAFYSNEQTLAQHKDRYKAGGKDRILRPGLLLPV